jgi:hypothetical protein
MRLFFIDSQFKLVPLESSYSRNIFAHYSPHSFRLTQLLSKFKLKHDSKKTVRRKHLSPCYPSPASMPGLSHYHGKQPESSGRIEIANSEATVVSVMIGACGFLDGSQLLVVIRLGEGIP